MAGFEFDPAERAAWDTALIAYLAHALPETTFGWSEYGRRLEVTFADGLSGSIWEPNFFFSRGALYSDATLFESAAAALTKQHDLAMQRRAAPPPSPSP